MYVPIFIAILICIFCMFGHVQAPTADTDAPAKETEQAEVKYNTAEELADFLPAEECRMIIKNGLFGKDFINTSGFDMLPMDNSADLLSFRISEEYVFSLEWKLVETDEGTYMPDSSSPDYISFSKVEPDGAMRFSKAISIGKDSFSEAEKLLREKVSVNGNTIQEENTI
ncbi:MAG: hypothetical protein J1F63_04270 [Oscillospiraceae bacterium]|nr:hypothetical protein [Oscillospiraceae bacterium]